MLYFLVVWTVLLILGSAIGLSGLTHLPDSQFHRPGDRWIAAVWLGTILLAISLLTVALGLPLSPLIGLASAAILFGLAIRSAAVRQELRTWGRSIGYWSWLIGAIALLLAIWTTQPVTWIDTGLYHYSLIQWLNQAGIVPGLALIFANFAFNSAWFALTAPFSPSAIGDQVSAMLGGYVLLLAVLQIGVCGRSIQRGQGRLSDWFLVIFSLLMLLFSLIWPPLGEISVSPSPDVPVAFLTGLVPWSILVIADRSTLLRLDRSDTAPADSAIDQINQIDQIDQPAARMRQSTRSLDSILPLILAIGAVTFKLTALPLLFVAGLFYAWQNRSRWRIQLIGVAAILLLLAPFFAAQIQTSGCPLFPSNLLCLNIPTAVSPEISNAVVNNTHNVKNWYQWGEDRSILPAIWQWLTFSRSNQLLVLLPLVSVVAMGLLRRSLRHYWAWGIGWVIAIQLVGMVFHGMTTLLFRFVLPSLLPIPALLIALIALQVPKFSRLSVPRLRQPQRWGAVLLALSFGAALVVRSGNGLFLPPPLQPVEVSLERASNFSFFSPQGEGALCWGTQIPCAFTIKPNVQLRDPDRGLAGGFIRQVQQADSPSATSPDRKKR